MFNAENSSLSCSLSSLSLICPLAGMLLMVAFVRQPQSWPRRCNRNQVNGIEYTGGWEFLVCNRHRFCCIPGTYRGFASAAPVVGFGARWSGYRYRTDLLGLETPFCRLQCSSDRQSSETVTGQIKIFPWMVPNYKSHPAVLWINPWGWNFLDRFLRTERQI